MIAAPSCCGKTTFIENIRTNGLPELTDSLDMGDHESWLFIDSEKLPEISNTRVPKMVLHYALPALPLKNGVIRSIADDVPMAVLHKANEISFVTLYASQTTLLNRIRKRKGSRKSGRWPIIKNIVSALAEISFLRSRSRLLRKNFRLKELEKLFSNPGEFAQIYQSWFDFSRQFQAKIDLVVNTEGVHTMQPISALEEILLVQD